MRLLPPASVLPTLLISPVWAVEYQFVPTFSLAQTYTDNVALAPSGLESSDWVTIARPGVSFVYSGAKLKFNANYTAEILYRTSDQGINVNNQFSGGTTGSMEIVPQIFFLDTNSTVSQYNTSINGPLATSNVNTTNNRSTVTTTVLSPYARYNFANEAMAEVRYTYSIVSSDAQGANQPDSGANRINANLTSGPGYKLTTWSLAYSRETVDYTSGPDQVLLNYSGTVRRLITPLVGVSATAGYEDNGYTAAVGQNSGGMSWNVGMDWTPTPRTNLSATIGRRYFGKTEGLNFSHRTRLTVWGLSYTEDVTTTRAQFLVPSQSDTSTYLDSLYLTRYPDPVARQQAVQQFIAQSGLPPTVIVPVNFFTNQTFLQKTWRGSAGLQGPIHTFLANFFMTTRDTVTPGLLGGGDFSSNSSVRQSGVGLVWNWRITAQDSSNVSVGVTRNEIPGQAQEDRSKYFRAAYNHQFSPKMFGSMYYQRLQNDSNVSTADYTENQVSAQVQLTF